MSAHIVEIENSIDKEKRLLESKTKEIEKVKHVYKLQSGDLNLVIVFFIFLEKTK